MGSSLDGKHSTTRFTAKVAWYRPCMRWSRGGASGRCVGEGKIWVVGWVCRRGFFRRVFVKCVFLGYFYGIFLGQVNGCELGSPYGVFLEIF